MSQNEKKKTNAELVKENEQLTTQVQQLQAAMQEAQAYVAVLERANVNYAQKEVASGRELAATQLRNELLERTLQQAQPVEGEVADGAPELTVVDGSGDGPDSPSED